MSIFDRIVEYSNISKPSERVPKEDGGMLVEPSDDGLRPGYKGKKSNRYTYSDNYRTIYDKETKLYSKKVGRDKKILTQEPGETKREFFKRVSNYSTETAAARTGKFTKEIVDARSKIDSWTSNWLSKNLKNYGVRDFDKMAKDLKRDWKIESKKLKLPTDKIKIFTESGFPNLSTSKGKETAVSKNPFIFDDVAFYTPENPSGKDKYMAQWKKIFFKNKIENTPGLKDKLSDYFKFMNLDKRGSPASGGPTIKSYKDIMDKDVAYILSEEDSGLKKGAKYDVFNSFDDLADSYNKFTLKMNRSESWKENANIIEEALGLKKNSIKNSMQAEQRALKKILDVSSLEGTGFGYSIDHGQGLAAAAKSGDVDLMKIALNDLIGTTKSQNTKAGFGGFEKVRGALIRDIQAGVNVSENVKSLNKLTNDVYKDLGVNKNIYSIKDNKLVSKPLSPQTTREQRFTSYFKDIYKTGEGKELIEKQYGNLNKLLQNITSYSKLPECKIGKSDGGRIGFALSDTCIRDGLLEQKKLAAAGNKKAAQELVDVAKVASRGGLLKNVLGPGAILGEAVFEGAIIGNKVLGGKPLKEAWAESYLSYLDPRKYRGELDPMLMERSRMLESSADKNILRSGFAAQDQLSAFNKAIEERDRAKKASRIDQYLPAAAEAREQGRFVDQSADIISNEAFKDATNVAQEYIQGRTGENIAKYKLPQIGKYESGEAIDLRKRREKEMKNLYNQYSDKELMDMLASSEPLQKAGISPQEYLNMIAETKRITPAVTSTLTGLEALRSAMQEQEAMENLMGGAANFAGGGLANLTKTIPPESGPQSEGLLSLKNRVINS